SKAQVLPLVARVDYRKIQLKQQQSSVAIGKAQRIDLGGIAKGYAVDAAVAILRKAKLHSFLVQAGGDLYGAGKKPDGSAWVSGIRDPRGGSNDFFATLELEDRAFSTAGDYARAFIKDGKRYHHIIDPRTGFPATACRSVTVWAKDALTADAVDDAVFILGVEAGLKIVAGLEGTGVVVVDGENRVHISERLKGKVRLTRPPSDGI
nr:FAD:protein FMN transferase [Polyangiaceae bacterium]